MNAARSEAGTANVWNKMKTLEQPSTPLPAPLIPGTSAGGGIEGFSFPYNIMSEETISFPWVISADGEEFGHRQHSTRDVAIEHGRRIYPNTYFWIGECVTPTQPEEFFDAQDWLETVSCQDEYCGEHAEDWDMSSKEQRAELTEEVKAVMAAWLKRHHLRPSFWNVEKVERIEPEPCH